jgi:hypothetical protein
MRDMRSPVRQAVQMVSPLPDRSLYYQTRPFNRDAEWGDAFELVLNVGPVANARRARSRNYRESAATDQGPRYPICPPIFDSEDV